MGSLKTYDNLGKISTTLLRIYSHNFPPLFYVQYKKIVIIITTTYILCIGLLTVRDFIITMMMMTMTTTKIVFVIFNICSWTGVDVVADAGAVAEDGLTDHLRVWQRRVPRNRVEFTGRRPQ